MTVEPKNVYLITYAIDKNDEMVRSSVIIDNSAYGALMLEFLEEYYGVMGAIALGNDVENATTIFMNKTLIEHIKIAREEDVIG